MDKQQNKAENKQEPYSSNSFDLDEQIQERLGKIESFSLELKKKILRMLHYSRGHVPTGIMLLSIGAASLVFSYLWSSSILTFIGLGITFWGVLIMYITPSRRVRAEMLNSISSSMQKCVDNLVSYMGYTGEVIFFHPKSLKGLGQGYIFIPHYAAKAAGVLNSEAEALNLLPYSSGSDTPPVYLDPKGIFLAAPSQGLVDLFEKELAVNFATVDFDYVQQALPKLLVEELEIVDEISIIQEAESGAIVARMSGGPCSEMCRSVDIETRLGKHLGCPMCSAVALVLSKVTGNPVSIKDTVITEDNMISTTYVQLNH